MQLGRSRCGAFLIGMQMGRVAWCAGEVEEDDCFPGVTFLGLGRVMPAFASGFLHFFSPRLAAVSSRRGCRPSSKLGLERMC